MENTTSKHAKTTPKDFFLWLGAIIALYGSISFLITLLFEYINYTFPDSLAGYGDPYGGSVRFAMASLIVMVPTALVLLRLIRNTITVDPDKAHLWIRRWALMLTLFLSALVGLIDLVTLINTFLGGEVTTRFILKVAIVLLISGGVFLHFLADLKGYWIRNLQKSLFVGVAVAVLVFSTIVSGFFIIGSPTYVRMLRYDDQKVQDLQSIQYQITNYYQQKRTLPKNLEQLNDPLNNFQVPTDTQTGASYVYEVTAPLGFKLCATFNEATSDEKGRGSYGAPIAKPMMAGGISDVWTHSKGQTCFDRAVDPDKFPPFSNQKGVPQGL